ncbi:hypothetical protein KC336_g7944 [Hortaea werneckii]|nr:hypothetical protein KC336_g7944 [Hortaea werneckii]
MCRSPNLYSFNSIDNELAPNLCKCVLEQAERGAGYTMRNAIARELFEGCNERNDLESSTDGPPGPGVPCHQQRARDLLDELGALNGALASLRDIKQSLNDLDFSGLEIPLQRCGSACADFEEEILKCASHSTVDRTSFRDWAKLRRKSSATAEGLERHGDLTNTTKADLEDRLESMDSKLELMLEGKATASEADAQEVKLIQEERLSTEKCLQICAQLSKHIAQIQLTSMHRSSGESLSSASRPSEQITSEGLEGCKNSLSRTAEKLKSYESELFTRSMDKSAAVVASDNDRADLTRLRNEWEATRQSMEICAQAYEHIRNNVSTIYNYATGDAVQFMVSTSEKTIHGHNRRLGWRTRQVGGHIDKDVLRDITRSLTSITMPVVKDEGSLSNEIPLARDKREGSELDATFVKQYGKGCKLKSSD